MLGSEAACYFSVDYDILRAGSGDIDIRDPEQSRKFIDQFKPDIILNCAAIANVDLCEKERELAKSVNTDGPETLAHICNEDNIYFAHYSTDYVFDGEKKEPYIESDGANPINYYGQTKCEAEQRILEINPDFAVIRVAWIYANHEKSFIRKLIQQGLNQIVKKGHKQNIEPIRVVIDQVGTPTSALDIVKQTAQIIDNRLSGIIHCTAEGETTRYNVAEFIFSELSMPVDIQPIGSDQFDWLAPRPKYTVLENEKLKSNGLNIMPDYKTAVGKFLKELEQY